VIDRDSGPSAGPSADAVDDDQPLPADAEGEGAAPRDRRAADVIRRKQEERVRSAIQTELSHDEKGAEPRPRPEDPGALSGAVIEVERVSLAFDRPILEDVSFAAFPGETLVIVGESGTGKSTILKLILRLLQPDSGHVYVCGSDVAGLTFTEALGIRQRMGMVFQSAALFDSMTVFENVAYPLREHTDLDEDAIEARVREKLEFVDLDADDVMEKLPAELSGGMKKRVGIARGMSNNAEIMLYDEPTSGLDPLTTGTITRLIMKLQRELNVTSVVVSHDIRSAFRMATHIALLADRSIRFFGTPEEMTASDDRYIRDFLGGY
jgi:phospholipid/cholesterol/gamma-HCH transport system ATP-binding protein